MSRKAIIPESFPATAETLDLSPVILPGDHLFLTGTTGSDPDGYGSGGLRREGAVVENRVIAFAGKERE